ncbi:MAG: C-GCAxxG-C-C family protein [Cyanobacteria bacterium RUI128]|nr:C-GCAxxG-C-C family protein [Cyanobacteria bacterium RUI128]
MDNKRAEAGVEYKHNGCNCCQAVLMAYSDLLSTDKDTLMSLGSGFGLGMGCMEGTCGALCGAVAAAGLINSGENSRAVSKQILNSFKEKCGGTICKDLKGIETGKMLCSCDDCVKNAIIALSESEVITV